MKARQASQSGFTLIEVLLAMTLVLLVGTATFQGYRTALDASGRATAALLRVTDERRVADFIRTELLAGRQSGEVHSGGEVWQWKVVALQREESVLGYDYELMQLRRSGRFISLYQVDVSDPRGDFSWRLELLGH